MTFRLALRSFAAQPVRTLVLAGGFGIGIASMAGLLGVGEVILEQSRSPALDGGGDVVVSGEGETALPELMSWIEADSKGPLPAGVLRALPDGTIEGSPAVWAEDLDALPLPAWNLGSSGYLVLPTECPG